MILKACSSGEGGAVRRPGPARHATAPPAVCEHRSRAASGRRRTTAATLPHSAMEAWGYASAIWALLAIAATILVGMRAGRLEPASVLLRGTTMLEPTAATAEGERAINAAEEPRVIRADPSFDRLVAPDARIEKIVSGLTWTEGPVWSEVERALYFSEIPSNRIYRWTGEEGARVFLEHAGWTGNGSFTGREPGSNGLLLDADGRLVICQHGDRRIARVEKDGTRTILADRFEGRRLNSPNDVIAGPGGDLFFTDPPFGLPGTFEDPARELDFTGVYRLSADGTLRLLTSVLTHANGIALSPSGGTLYVSDAVPGRPRYVAFDVRPDGTLGEMRVLFDASEWAGRWPGSADGIEVDGMGRLFAAGPGGVHVFSPRGKHLGSVILGKSTSNLAWAEGGSSLIVTAGDSLYRIRIDAGS